MYVCTAQHAPHNNNTMSDILTYPTQQQLADIPKHYATVAHWDDLPSIEELTKEFTEAMQNPEFYTAFVDSESDKQVPREALTILDYIYGCYA